MNLYSLTLQQTTGIHKAIPGKFSNSHTQEIVVSKVKHVELLRWNEQAAKLQSIVQSEVFGLIRDMQTFRLPGSDRDHIVIGTDAGRVVILQFDSEKNQFVKVHQETYGKTGCRRIVPGQFLACDPRGRAFMISATEKNKFVYILNRENERVTVSSPLEAPKSHTVVFSTVGLDAGYDNAIFAALEVDYGDWQDKDSVVCNGQVTKFLTLYEMDFGLNTVKRRTSEPVDESAHQLIMVPFAPDGPGGVVVLCEDFLVYRGAKGVEQRVPYPKRLGAPGDRGVLINAVAFHRHKGKFFHLIQTELGDLFELQFHFTHEEVHNITLQYFDTIPVASNLCFLRQGFLFAPCDRGNHMLYQITSLGKEEDTNKHLSPIVTDAGMKHNDLVYFTPRRLTHLKLHDEMKNYSCITQVQVADLVNEGNPQIYTLCAAGARSTMRVLRHGLAVTQLANTNLPGKPLAIWTIKQNQNDEFHNYIILSFLNQTVVLSISQVVAEAKDSGLENQRQSLHVGLLEDNSIIQVLSNGYRHILRSQAPQSWIVEGKVIKACSNQRQLALGLAGGELHYFELNAAGQLVEVCKERMEHEITALELGPIEEGRVRSTLMAVGLSDHTVRLVSLEPESCLERLGILALPSIAESLCMMEMASQDFGAEHQSLLTTTQLFLFLGLNNGVLMRSSVDSLSGQLSDTRTRYLGTKQVKCFRVVANGQSGMLALSSRPWLCYNHLQKIYMQPLSYDNLDYAASFNTMDFIGGIVGISGSTLRIVAPDRYGELFNETVVPLSYSPRKLVIHEESKAILIIESDNRTYNQRELIEKKLEISQESTYNIPQTECCLYAPVYKWAACVRLIDPKTLATVQLHEFENNEHALSVTFLQFSGYDEQYLCVGTVRDLQNEPVRRFTEGVIHTFTINNGREITLLHSTPIDEVPYALSPWRGRLLVGAGSHLRVYEMGKKRLLKKAELKSLNSFITGIHVHHDRIFVTQASDSVHLLRYRIKEQTFMEIADDILPRWVTASCLLDYHTIIAADKFENFFVSRVPMDIDMEQEEHPFEFKMKMDQGCMNGAPFKMDQICNFYYGEIITTLQKAALVSTANEVIVFGTSMGSIGALFPFDTKEDIDFFLHLEMYMRVEATPLSGRDHMMFRSFYGPCKAVVDGDLCEEFSSLAYSKKRAMAEEFDRTPADIMKKLEDVRNKIL